VVGGPNVGRQLLKAGLVDELQIGIMPSLLGEGQRLSEFLEGTQIILKKTRLVETGQRTDLVYCSKVVPLSLPNSIPKRTSLS
jgi:riboflavin biosynthesis pyrimidine reductase